MVLVNEKLNVSQQHVLAMQKVSHILGCIESSVASRVRMVIAPLCPASSEQLLQMPKISLQPFCLLHESIQPHKGSFSLNVAYLKTLHSVSQLQPLVE